MAMSAGASEDGEVMAEAQRLGVTTIGIVGNEHFTH